MTSMHYNYIVHENREYQVDFKKQLRFTIFFN